VREPLSWWLKLEERAPLPEVAQAIRAALPGTTDDTWDPPAWLLPHQRAAARRVAGRLTVFGGALLADAVGLGKTYVALALAQRYRQPAAVVPAALASQWRRTGASVGVDVVLVTHEALSRGSLVPPADLVVVDEAHRFRNPATLRYDALARGIGSARVLLLTATPMVNRAADLGALLRLFLPDNGLALLGVPSIESAVSHRAYHALAHALAAVTVARTAAAAGIGGTIPAARDGAVYDDPTLDPTALRGVAAGIDALAFPTLAAPDAPELMRLHLFSRLASSAPALETTLRRHLRYLDLAVAAAVRGERLSRRALAGLLQADREAQFELDLFAGAATHPVDASALEAERERLRLLLAHVQTASVRDPKADRLCHQLGTRSRTGNAPKTIVFTTAIATALHLARRLGWQRLVVATGRGARIASGAVALPDALALFAPIAQGVTPPGAAQAADVLLATDLASEGLNLQDADLVVHYDLPWSPVRLAQRLGRIARLGSSHLQVHAWWFGPPPDLAERLGITRRVADKARSQLATGVTGTSMVGRARLDGGLLDWREAADRSWGSGKVGYEMVNGPAAAVVALEWHTPRGAIPEVLLLEGDPLSPVLNETRLREVATQLTRASPVAGRQPSQFHRACLAVVRERLGAAQRGPVDTETRALVRRILRRARAAARNRDVGRLEALDRALNRLTAGLPSGGLRELAHWLHSGPPTMLPQALARKHPHMGPASVRMVAVLFGNGHASRADESDVYSSRRAGPWAHDGSRGPP
jgi:hypothetical protein